MVLVPPLTRLQPVGHSVTLWRESADSAVESNGQPGGYFKRGDKSKKRNRLKP